MLWMLVYDGSDHCNRVLWLLKPKMDTTWPFRRRQPSPGLSHSTGWLSNHLEYLGLVASVHRVSRQLKPQPQSHTPLPLVTWLGRNDHVASGWMDACTSYQAPGDSQDYLMKNIDDHKSLNRASFKFSPFVFCEIVFLGFLSSKCLIWISICSLIFKQVSAYFS